MGSSNRLRVSSAISVRFRPQCDDDLKEWWNNEPDRAYIIRRLLREYLAQGEQPPTIKEPPASKKTQAVPTSIPQQPRQKPSQDTGGDPMSMGVYS